MVGLIQILGHILAQEGSEPASAIAQTAPNWFVQHAFLIPLFCFASAALTLFFGKRTPGKGPVYGILALSAGLILARGEPTDVLTADRVKAAFGLPVTVVPDPVTGTPLIVPTGAPAGRSKTTKEKTP